MACFHLVDLLFIDIVMDSVFLIRHDDRAAVSDVYHRVCHIFVEVAARSCHIMRQFRKSRKACKGNILRAADAELCHAAAPYRNMMGNAEVMDALSFIDTAAAAGFDIDDLAAAKTDCHFCRFVGNDAFIEADRCLDSFLERGMVDDIFFSERLFNVLEMLFIHGAEEVDILKRVGGIGIDGKRDIPEFLPDGLDDFNVAARMDFDLRSVIAKF